MGFVAGLIIGLLAGSFIGVAMMCLLVAGKDYPKDRRTWEEMDGKQHGNISNRPRQ